MRIHFQKVLNLGLISVGVFSPRLDGTPTDCHDPSQLCADDLCPCEFACFVDQQCPPGMVCSLSEFSPLGCVCTDKGVWEVWSDSTANKCVLAPVRVKPPVYTIEDLGTLGGSSSAAHAINNRGQVVGEAQDDEGRPKAFLWNQGLMLQLDEWPTAIDINNFGQVLLRYPYRSAVWENGVVQIIQGFNPPGDAVAKAINDAGTTVGYSYDSALGQNVAFSWWKGVTSKLEMGLFPNDINNVGQIAGSIDVDGQAHGAVWNGEKIIDLGTLGGTYSFAAALNNHIEVIGSSERAPGGDRKFYMFAWRGQVPIDLSEIANDHMSLGPYAINNCGEIIECGFFYDSQNRVSLIEKIIDPTLRWYLICGESINDYGEIVGRAVQYGVFAPRAFLMTPIHGDMNRDGDVDLQDFARVQKAFTGSLESATPDCERADIDRDADVDLVDMTMLGTRLYGPEQSPPIP